MREAAVVAVIVIFIPPVVILLGRDDVDLAVLLVPVDLLAFWVFAANKAVLLSRVAVFRNLAGAIGSKRFLVVGYFLDEEVIGECDDEGYC